MSLSQKELDFIHDTDFLISKREILRKGRNLLKECSQTLEELFQNPAGVKAKYFDDGVKKISSGENYRGLPYLVLDYPSFFGKNETFSFRIILWWGNYFIFSLHLEGPPAQRALSKIDPSSSEVYFSIHNSPWDHYFDEDNFVPLSKLSTSEIEAQLKQNGFIKIGLKRPLGDWAKIPNDCKNIAEHLLKYVGH